MKRIETIPFKKFMDVDNYHAEVKQLKEEKRIKYTKYALVAGYTIVLVSGFGLVGHAAGVVDPVTAAGNIDKIGSGGYVIYKKLLAVGRWIIIIKGGIDTVNSMVQDGGGAAKRNFLTYLIVYLVLKGLPVAFDWVDVAFQEVAE